VGDDPHRREGRRSGVFRWQQQLRWQQLRRQQLRWQQRRRGLRVL